MVTEAENFNHCVNQPVPVTYLPGDIVWCEDGPYVCSPAMAALADVRKLQAMMRALMGHKSEAQRRADQVCRVKSFPRLNVRLLLASGALRHV